MKRNPKERLANIRIRFTGIEIEHLKNAVHLYAETYREKTTNEEEYLAYEEVCEFAVRIFEHAQAAKEEYKAGKGTRS